MVKYLILLFIFFTMSAFATDFTGDGGDFGGGGAGGSWGSDSATCSGGTAKTYSYYPNSYHSSLASVCAEIATKEADAHLKQWGLTIRNDLSPIEPSTCHGYAHYLDGYKAGQTAGPLDYKVTVSNNSCSCAADEYYSLSSNTCVKKTCDAPYVYDPAQDKCVAPDPPPPPTCSAGQHLDTATNTCVDDPPPPDEPPPTDDKCECCEQIKQILNTINSTINNINSTNQTINNNLTELKNIANTINNNITNINNNAPPPNIDLSALVSAVNAVETAVKTHDSNTQAKIDEAIKQAHEDSLLVQNKLDDILKELKRPKQCSDGEFNKKICDFIDYMEVPASAPSEVDSNVTVNDLSDIDWRTIAEQNYLVLPNNCPFNPLFHVPFLGAAASIIFPLDIICGGAVMLKVVLMLWASSVALRIIGETPL